VSGKRIRTFGSVLSSERERHSALGVRQRLAAERCPSGGRRKAFEGALCSGVHIGLGNPN
jgi:hypothetical protein